MLPQTSPFLRRFIARPVAAALLLLTLACLAWGGRVLAAPREPAATPSQRFDVLVDEYIDYRYRVSPTLATRQGAAVYDDRLEDVSTVGTLTHVEALALWARDVRRVDAGRLAPQQRIDRDLILADIEAGLWEEGSVRCWERDPGAYGRLAVRSIVPLLAPVARGDEQRRARVLLARMRLVPALFEHARITLERPSALLADAALQEVPQLQAFFGEILPRTVAGIKDKRFQYEFREAHEPLVQAVAAWRDFLRGELASRATGDYRVGPDAMRARLRLDDADLSPERFVKEASAELAQAQEAVRALARQVRPGASVAEALAEASRGSLEPATLALRAPERVRTLAASCRAGQWNVPEAFPFGVGVVPALQAGTSDACVEVPGPFATGPATVRLCLAWREGGKAAQGVSEAALDRAILEEVVPGRGLRLLQARQAPTRFRRVMEDRSALEGWGPYAAWQAAQGGSEPANPALGLLVAHRLVRVHALALVAVQLHGRRMTEAQALGFLGAQAWLDADQAQAALVEAARDPGVVSASLGVLGLRRLTQDLRKAWGAGFAPRRFHDAVMAQGLIPVRILRRILEGRYDKR